MGRRLRVNSEAVTMKAAFLAAFLACLDGQDIFAQAPQVAPPSAAMLIARRIEAKAVVAVCAVPYCLDLAWQTPLGSRLGWLTASAANPDPVDSPARVFLLRGTGTIFTAGFGELCTKLRRTGIWTEDVADAGDHWVCRHLIAEQKAGRLRGAVVLVGHSRGGRHALDAARELKKAGIAVDLLVCVDVAMPPTVPGNVRRAISLYKSQRRIYPADPLQREDGSITGIENVDLSDPNATIPGRGLHHFNITASPAVHDLIIRRIQKLAEPPLTRSDRKVP
jgi:Alpha/beta hydrolase family